MTVSVVSFLYREMTQSSIALDWKVRELPALPMLHVTPPPPPPPP